MTETRRTVCNRDCPDACSILAHVDNGRIVKLTGDPSHPVTRGFLCYRTSHFLEQQYAADRILNPLLRVGDSFQPISWQEAISRIVEAFTRIRKESGPEAIFHYRSGGSLGFLLSLADHFFELLGPVTTKSGDICSGAGDAAQLTDFGILESNDLFDLIHSKNIVLWGKNLFVSSPHTIPVIKQAKKHGASVVVIDPVFNKTFSLADVSAQPRPGGDLALAMAVARIVIDEKWVDPNAMAYCDHWEEFSQLCHQSSVEQWCDKADVAPSFAFELAKRLGVNRPTAILVGWGMGRRKNGSSIVRALDALSAITGNLGVSGGGVSFYYNRKTAFDVSFKQGISARTICEPLLGRELLDTRDPPIRAMWVTAGNPVVMLPDSKTVARAIGSREFVVVADSWMSDTAKLAHIVLPTTTLLESDDLVGAYGHHWLGVAKPVVERPENVRHDFEIFQQLANQFGFGEKLAGSARAWKERIIQSKLVRNGISLEDLESGYVRNPNAPQIVFADRVFQTKSGKVNLMTEMSSKSAQVSDRFPLLLTSVSTENSQSSQWVRISEGPIDVYVHPDSSNGCADGQYATLESEVGSITVRVRWNSELRKDIVLIPKGGHLSRGHAANALIRAMLTDAGEGGALYDEPVRLVPKSQNQSKTWPSE